MHEADEWASDHGFSQCVSPDIKREGTDNGLWVTAHHKRWTLWDRHEVAHGVVISNDWFGDRLNWWFVGKELVGVNDGSGGVNDIWILDTI